MGLLGSHPGVARPDVARPGLARASGLFLALMLAIPCALQATTARAATLEYAVKANYLYKFAPFIEWPPQTFARSSSPFSICVLGADPFGAALDTAVQGQRIGDHSVVVRRLALGADLGACQVLYVGALSRGQASGVLRQVQGQPTLTVEDGDQDLPGGVIRFILKDGHVRFSIDDAAAQANGLVISSKLQGLALSIRPRRAP
jgi:hypothetical protein